MSDLINRQAAIDGILHLMPPNPNMDDGSAEQLNFSAWKCALTCAEASIKMMPSAQPNRWIPVTERLPEDSEYHLVTEYHMVSFARYWEHRWWDAFGDKAKYVTAWMPLPEPYKS